MFQRTGNPKDLTVGIGGTDGTLAPARKMLIFLLCIGMPNKSACHSTHSSLACQVRTTGAKSVCQQLQCSR